MNDKTKQLVARYEKEIIDFGVAHCQVCKGFMWYVQNLLKLSPDELNEITKNLWPKVEAERLARQQRTEQLKQFINETMEE